MEFGNDPPQTPVDDDDMMEDDAPRDEDIEAMLASYEQDAHTTYRPRSSSFSDDEYDDIFADLMSQEQPNRSQSDPADAMCLSQEMAF